MKKLHVRSLAWLVSLCFALFAFQATAATASAANKVEKKPFAEAHVALQISDGNPFKQTLVLNVAHNLLKHYGPDKVDIEVVAFSKGLRLLFADNANQKRIDALAGAGVRFSACNNTLHHMTKLLGHKPKLNSHAVVVPAGIVRLLQLKQAGYTVVKP
ncbi:MAG TPA: hypothetical protein VKA14_02305 [Gammaproteobacteria bacterium]|nr:hypothetical protein [Gammaproteobacteria bacterium]